jgi:hypothetical protein
MNSLMAKYIYFILMNVCANDLRVKLSILISLVCTFVFYNERDMGKNNFLFWLFYNVVSIVELA